MKTLKKSLAIASLLILLAGSASAYVGNSNSFKFHTEGCRFERKIRNNNRVYFKTKNEGMGHARCAGLDKNCTLLSKNFYHVFCTNCYTIQY